MTDSLYPPCTAGGLPGILVGIDKDKSKAVVQHPRPTTPEGQERARSLNWRGGPCFTHVYPLQEVVICCADSAVVV